LETSEQEHDFYFLFYFIFSPPMVKVVLPRLLPLSHCETHSVEIFSPRSSETQTSDNLMVCGATPFDQNL